MDHTQLGAVPRENGVQYCLWAPGTKAVTVDVRCGEGNRIIPLTPSNEGFHIGVDPDGRPGDAYGYRIDGGELLPDPASRGQENDVHGRSLVIDPTAWTWTDSTWQRPPFRDLVIYELHVGTFSPAGTFLGAIERLSHLRDLGINSIELMPIGDFPGSRNWGYDGVLLYAPARCYGTPDDLRALVDAAHAHGIAVILDVVYNHFGPDGNRLGAFTPRYFSTKHHTPWGSAFNLDEPDSRPVRDFFVQNATYWMTEFHIDGFRFDATHEIPDASERHLLAELTQCVHDRGGYAIAEDDRNETLTLRTCEAGGLGFDACWADDFHHSARVSQTQENHSYLADFQGTMDELITVLQNGWLFRGQHSQFRKSARGTPCADYSPSHFVHCISNHDQTGNRAYGDRINQIIAPESYRMLSVLLCLTPYTPLLFMGQEWAAETPFLYFADHEPVLGAKITEGRRREFSGFPEFANPEQWARIPDPQGLATFENSKLNWDERALPGHQEILALYRCCLRLRREEKIFRPEGRREWTAEALPWGAGRISFGSSHQLVFALQGDLEGTLPDSGAWEVLLSSADPEFGGAGRAAWDAGRLVFRQPEAVVLARRG